MATSYLCFIFLVLSIRAASGAPNFIFYNCTTANNFTANSFYSTNLNQLLPALASQASSNSFYNLTAGSDPNAVYGLYYCRGDISTQDCNDCIKTAASEIVSRCPVEKEAIVWYKECTLRYSNRSIFSVEEEEPGIVSWSLSNVSNPRQFIQSLGSIVDRLNQQASFNSSAKKNYAKGEIAVTDSQTIYCLVQCTPDLNGTQCQKCLERARGAIRDCCLSGSNYALFNLPSCRLMYDTVAFGSTSLPPSTNGSSDPIPNQTSTSDHKGKGAEYYVIRIVVPVAAAVLLLLLVSVFLFRSRLKVVEKKHEETDSESKYQIEGASQFDLGTMKAATENFSSRNKLGEGGFGIVYKGNLQSGQEVAIKRLSEESKQGVKQFINEVQLVAKLQHRNLVKLVGFCTEGEERLVVYEFMPKLSLDYYLFDRSKTKHLPWETRYKIIEGIARGLHYLHEDSRHKVVHRDLKASNILLDEHMNPKIADFGIAKQVVVDQTQSNTTKIVGTRGYMAPEYLLAGQYSVKSDVYSFGVLLLEIITSRSSSQQYQLEHSEGLLAYAWKRWTEGEIEELIDPTLRTTVSRMEVGRCIQIGLLCAQYEAVSRPTMYTVLLMLNSRGMELPSPSPPSPFAHGVDTPHSSYQQTGSEVSTDVLNLEKDLYPR